MSVSQHIPKEIKRTCRAIGYAAWLDDTDSWMGLPVVLMARLTVRQRAALAYAALKSLDHDLACRTADAVLSTPIKQGGGRVMGTDFDAWAEAGFPDDSSHPLNMPHRDPDSFDFPPSRRTAVAQPKRESAFYSAASLKDRPVKAREWLVPDLVPQKTVTLFSGDGGTGKSLLALQLAVSVAASRAWIGKPVSEGSVIYISAEDDDDELHRRVDDILRAESETYDAIKGLTLRSLAGEDALLAVESQVALMASELFSELDQRAADETPALIVIDTLADVYPANENDRAKVRQFIGILRGLALKRNCAVMLLGHPSLSGLNTGSGTSGSTAWNNSVRSRIYLSRITDNGFEMDPDRRVLTSMKSNYGRVGSETHMKWASGVFVVEEAAQGFDALAAGAKAQRVFVKLLSTYTAQGRQVNHAGGSRYAPKLFAEHPDNEGMTKRAFKAAMEGLLAAEKIVIRTEGPASRRTSFIAEAGQ